jgi:hypothetical protein
MSLRIGDLALHHLYIATTAPGQRSARREPICAPSQRPECAPGNARAQNCNRPVSAFHFVFLDSSPRKERANVLKIAECIGALLNPLEPKFRFEREFATVRFCGFLNWPEEETAPDALALLMLLHILKTERRDISQQFAIDLVRQLDSPTLLSVIQTSGFVPLPSFFDIDPKEKHFSNNEYAADVVRFLLTFGSPKAKEVRRRPSLGKASVFINQKGGFPGDKHVLHRSQSWGETTHQKIWKKHKAAAPFQFVRRYDSNLNWLVDPSATNFFDRITDLAARRSDLGIFFAKSLWVQNKLAKIVDHRSIPKSAYIDLPSTLKPVACKLPTKPPKFMAAMEGYSRNRAMLDSD